MQTHNILIVMHGAGTGGVEKSIKTLCKYINKKNFNVVVALPSEGPLKTSLDNMGIETLVAPMDSWTPIKFHFGERHYYQFLSGLKERVKALVEIIKENKVDIVHSSTLSVADGAFAAKIAGTPHIWHIHGKSVGTTDAYGSYLPVRTLYELVNSLSAKVVAVSEDVRKFMERYITGNHIQVIYNGIDLREFDSLGASPSTIRDEFSVNGKKLVTLIGRIARVKGIEDYLDSAIKVLEKRDDVVFLVVGPEEDEDMVKDLKERVNSRNLSDCIIFTGGRSDIYHLLSETDIFVCSSKTEGLPYSCLEAMAASKPIITTKCGGPEELVRDGETGFHVNVNSPDEIARSVISLLDDHRLLKNMGSKSRELVETEFSARKFALKFEQLYLGLKNESLVKDRNPWDEVIVDMISNFGDMGCRIRKLEHEVRDLRNFERVFKDNFIYRNLSKIVNIRKG